MLKFIKKKSRTTTKEQLKTGKCTMLIAEIIKRKNDEKKQQVYTYVPEQKVCQLIKRQIFI